MPGALIYRHQHGWGAERAPYVNGGWSILYECDQRGWVSRLSNRRGSGNSPDDCEQPSSDIREHCFGNTCERSDNKRGCYNTSPCSVLR